MFGYVKANMSKLSEEEVHRYRSVYCTLCNSLKRHFGVSARFLLNYDITFLALLKLNEVSQCNENHGFCPYKMKQCTLISNQEAIFYDCACILIILAYEKILDNVRDETFFKKCFNKLLSLYFKRKYRKARQRYPALCDKIRYNMTMQVHNESNGVSLDAAAHPSADALGAIFAGSDEKNDYYYFGYMFGRWIYFMDAADDRQKDAKTGSFNVFGDNYNLSQIESTLNLCMGEAVHYYQALPKGAYSKIIENILYEGTYAAQQKVLKGAEVESV